MNIDKTIDQLEKSAKKHDIKLGKIVVCQCLGTKRQKILYRDINEAREFSGVQKPYCIIIPGELHFMEKKMLEGFI
jgi:diphthamide biosynthesis methyltransferase